MTIVPKNNDICLKFPTPELMPLLHPKDAGGVPHIAAADNISLKIPLHTDLVKLVG